MSTASAALIITVQLQLQQQQQQLAYSVIVHGMMDAAWDSLSKYNNNVKNNTNNPIIIKN